MRLAQVAKILQKSFIIVANKLTNKRSLCENKPEH